MARSRLWGRGVLGVLLFLVIVALPACDPDRAFHQAGEPHGRPEATRLQFVIETDAAHARWAEAVAGQLAVIGVRAEVRILDWSEAVGRALNGASDACLLSWSGPGLDLLGWPASKLSCAGAENLTGYTNREFDALLVACLTRLDDADRQALARTAQAFVREEAPWIFLVCDSLYDGVSSNLTGLTFEPGGCVSLSGAMAATGEKRVVVGLGLGRRPGLDPLVPVDPQAAVLMRNLFGSLVRLHPEEGLRPELASSWEWSRNSRRLAVRVRDEVLFHNGDPLTAADVVFTYETVLPGRLPEGLTFSVRAEGPLDVVFDFSAPLPQFLHYLGTQPIVPESYYRRTGSDGFSASPVGTGPFCLEPGSTSRQLVLVRCDRLEREAGVSSGEPRQLDEVVFIFVPDSDRRASMLRLGDIALAPSLNREQALALGQVDGLKLVRQPGVTVVCVELNNRRPPFADTRVRLALNLALDRSVPEEFPPAEASERPYCPVAGESIVHPGEGFGTDYERAARLLFEAGYLVSGP